MCQRVCFLALWFLPGTGLTSEVLLCAGPAAGRGMAAPLSAGAARPAQSGPQTRAALVLFSHFSGEFPAESPVPAWAAQIFDPDLPGSFSHFYDTMSLGPLRVRYGHILGLPDLFNARFLSSEEPLPPERDSAGIGRWGLMGWGALGWNGDDGPNPLSAWSRVRLGWASPREISATERRGSSVCRRAPGPAFRRREGATVPGVQRRGRRTESAASRRWVHAQRRARTSTGRGLRGFTSRALPGAAPRPPDGALDGPNTRRVVRHPTPPWRSV